MFTASTIFRTYLLAFVWVPNRCSLSGILNKYTVAQHYYSTNIFTQMLEHKLLKHVKQWGRGERTHWFLQNYVFQKYIFSFAEKETLEKSCVQEIFLKKKNSYSESEVKIMSQMISTEESFGLKKCNRQNFSSTTSSLFSN